jgi:hypothetical protein
MGGLEDKCKRTLFCVRLLLCAVSRMLKTGTGKTTECGRAKVVRSVRLKGEDFSTSAVTWKKPIFLYL